MTGHSPPTRTSPEFETTLEVVEVSEKNPKVRTVKVARPTLQESSFLPAVLGGLKITVGHFFRNVGGKKRKNHTIETINYPEEKIAYPERSRGLHRLTQREDGTVRCVACMCCPTVCPAHCITIIPAETHDSGVEKYPAVFEIDELRCVVCGLCVEACPCDAIRMDTGIHAKPVYQRQDSIETRQTLLERGIPSTAVQGGEGKDWRDT